MFSLGAYLLNDRHPRVQTGARGELSGKLADLTGDNGQVVVVGQLTLNYSACEYLRRTSWRKRIERASRPLPRRRRRTSWRTRTACMAIAWRTRTTSLVCRLTCRRPPSNKSMDAILTRWRIYRSPAVRGATWPEYRRGRLWTRTALCIPTEIFTDFGHEVRTRSSA